MSDLSVCDNCGGSRHPTPGCKIPDRGWCMAAECQRAKARAIRVVRFGEPKPKVKPAIRAKPEICTGNVPREVITVYRHLFD